MERDEDAAKTMAETRFNLLFGSRKRHSCGVHSKRATCRNGRLAVTDWLRFTLALVLWAKNRQCRVQRESCVKINYVFGA